MITGNPGSRNSAAWQGALQVNLTACKDSNYLMKLLIVFLTINKEKRNMFTEPYKFICLLLLIMC